MLPTIKAFPHKANENKKVVEVNNLFLFFIYTIRLIIFILNHDMKINFKKYI